MVAGSLRAAGSPSYGPLRAAALAGLSAFSAPPMHTPSTPMLPISAGLLGAGYLGAGHSGSRQSSAGQLMSVREAGVFPLEHLEWEAAMLDGAKEGIDETSLRMEMKTSMDIHRLMRLRQQVRGTCSRGGLR